MNFVAHCISAGSLLLLVFSRSTIILSFYTALSKHQPCLLNDDNWRYGSGLFTKKVSKNAKVCPEAHKNVNKRLFRSTKTIRDRSKEVPAVPLSVVDSLQFCHEDVELWYVGVIMDFFLEHPKFIEKKMREITSEQTRLKNVDEFCAVHIRSTDKVKETSLQPPKLYAR